MIAVLKNFSFICYALITFGLLWLYSLNRRSDGLYESVTLNTNEWIGSHLILLIGAILIFPTTWALKNYLKSKSKYLVDLAVAFTFLGTIALISQYILDFYLITLFQDQTSDSAYKALNQLQSNDYIRIFCYDLIAIWLLGQILFIIALFQKKDYPIWALGLFILGIIILVFGDKIHDLVERISYLLLSIALMPIPRQNLSVKILSDSEIADVVND